MSTLQQMADAGDSLMVYCEAYGCNHCWPLDFAAAIKSLGPDFVITADRKRFLHHLVCSKCGARNPSITYSTDAAHRASAGAASTWGMIPASAKPAKG